jgi:phage head maturation protease
MTKTAVFKYTFPIAKAEERADGFYVVGYASGPEVDTEEERMAPEAIARFAEQINASDPDFRLPYRDAHAPDGVLRDLGDITKAWVNEHFHLGIEVKLNMDNPAAAFLFKQLKKGKQYGMSVAGHVVDYAMEYADEVGKAVLTYKDVVLDEISNTTRPAWYPSFGTVLAKSIKDASSGDATGETAVKVGPNGELLDETVEDATKSEADESAEDTTEKAADEAADSTDETTEKAAESEATEDETEKSDESEDADVEKAGRKLSGATSAKLLGLYNAFTDELKGLGVIAPEATEEETSEKSASAAEEDTTEKAEEDESTDAVITKADLDVLAAALSKANERIAELEARPATEVPGVITDATKKAAADELAEVLAKATPSERMRLAFAAHTGGK